MSGHRLTVVPMRFKMCLLVGGVATDQVPLHPRDLHKKQLSYLGNHAKRNASRDRLFYLVVFDEIVAAAFEGVIEYFDVIAHEAAVAGLLRVIKRGETVAKGRI